MVTSMVVAYRCYRGGGTVGPMKVQGFGNARACVVGILGYLRNLRTHVYLVIPTLIGQFRDDSSDAPDTLAKCTFQCTLCIVQRFEDE